MIRGLSRTLSLGLVVAAIALFGVACKTVQPAPDKPASAAPAFPRTT